MSQILIHSAFGVLEAKPMVLADIEHDSVSESEFSNINSESVLTAQNQDLEGAPSVAEATVAPSDETSD